MPKVKKSRKVGQIGVRSTPKADRVRPAPKTERKKKLRGKPAGSRQQLNEKSTAGQSHSAVNKDPRIGSKKPIDLYAKKPQSVPPPVRSKKYFSPGEELTAIENDTRLEKLLAALDDDQSLSTEDQQYVQQKLARHNELCQMLGIEEEDDSLPQPPDTENDLIATFEQNNLDKFR